MNIQQHLQSLREKAGAMEDRRTKRRRDRSGQQREQLMTTFYIIVGAVSTGASIGWSYGYNQGCREGFDLGRNSGFGLGYYTGKVEMLRDEMKTQRAQWTAEAREDEQPEPAEEPEPARVFGFVDTSTPRHAQEN